MFIRSRSLEKNAEARKARDLMQQSTATAEQRFYFIPSGLEHVSIKMNADTEQFRVILKDKYLNALDVVEGFVNAEDARHYAQIIVKQSGLSENCITEHGTFYVLVSIVEDEKGLYKVYGQGTANNGRMELKLLASCDMLELARDEADYEAASHDCPVVEILHNSRPTFRDEVYHECL